MTLEYRGRRPFELFLEDSNVNNNYSRLHQFNCTLALTVVMYFLYYIGPYFIFQHFHVKSRFFDFTTTLILMLMQQVGRQAAV